MPIVKYYISPVVLRSNVRLSRVEEVLNGLNAGVPRGEPPIVSFAQVSAIPEGATWSLSLVRGEDTAHNALEAATDVIKLGDLVTDAVGMDQAISLLDSRQYLDLPAATRKVFLKGLAALDLKKPASNETLVEILNRVLAKLGSNMDVRAMKVAF